MRNQNCPVCKGTPTLSAPPHPSAVWVGLRFFPFDCGECGAFFIEEGFHAQGWSAVPAEKKKVIAVYLKDTKGKHGFDRYLTSDSYTHLAHLGQKMLAQQPGRAGTTAGNGFRRHV